MRSLSRLLLSLVFLLVSAFVFLIPKPTLAAVDCTCAGSFLFNKNKTSTDAANTQKARTFCKNTLSSAANFSESGTSGLDWVACSSFSVRKQFNQTDCSAQSITKRVFLDEFQITSSGALGNPVAALYEVNLNCTTGTPPPVPPPSLAPPPLVSSGTDCSCTGSMKYDYSNTVFAFTHLGIVGAMTYSFEDLCSTLKGAYDGSGTVTKKCTKINGDITFKNISSCNNITQEDVNNAFNLPRTATSAFESDLICKPKPVAGSTPAGGSSGSSGPSAVGTAPPSISKVCVSGTNCTKAEVGPFMQGITSQCYNSGQCQLDDIMAVFANVGNWIAGIIAVIVFLFYVYGGFNLMLAGGSSERVQKGKTILKTATVGLLIVFGAYMLIATLSCTLLDRKTFQEITGPAWVKNICGK